VTNSNEIEAPPASGRSTSSRLSAMRNKIKMSSPALFALP